MRVDKLHLANSKPEDVAISYHSRRITYSEMECAVKKYAGYFRSLGVRDGTKVALLSINSPEFIFSYWGIIRAQGVVVPINLMFTPEEITYVLRGSDAEIMVVHPRIAQKIGSQALSGLGVKQVIILDEATQGLINSSDSLPEGDGEEEDTLAAILYTSGTTGKPKGAMLTHKNLCSNITSLRQSTIVSRYDNFLCVLPMFHSFAWTVCVLLPLYIGGKTVVLETFQPNETINTIVNERITFLLAVPPMFGILLRKAKRGQFKHIYVAVSGGAPTPREISYAFSKKFPINFIEGYGLTEAGPVVTINPVAGIKKVGSIGKALPGIQLIVADEEGQILPRGEIGEVLVKGDNVMQGYYKDEKATSETLVNGWLKTGDMGFMDVDDYVFLVDRKKDLIIVSGFNVYPSEIENLLYKHPKVEAAAVIGIRDKTRGEAAKAFIVLKEDEQMDKKELLDYLKPQLAPFKLPREVVFTDSLPTNATGKIMKRVLKQEEQSGQACAATLQEE